MWGITHFCNQWEGLTTELVKPRGPSPHVPPTQNPPTSLGSHLPEAPPSPLYSTALRPPPDQRSTRGKREGGTGLEFWVAVGPGGAASTHWGTLPGTARSLCPSSSHCGPHQEPVGDADR